MRWMASGRATPPKKRIECSEKSFGFQLDHGERHANRRTDRQWMAWLVEHRSNSLSPPEKKIRLVVKRVEQQAMSEIEPHTRIVDTRVDRDCVSMKCFLNSDGTETETVDYA
uniref:Bacteriophage protein n=1 Tax=Panagrellus redivivus TaxID=6233 RepID=A0A7E4UP38_PANRE